MIIIIRINEIYLHRYLYLSSIKVVDFLDFRKVYEGVSLARQEHFHWHWHSIELVYQIGLKCIPKRLFCFRVSSPRKTGIIISTILLWPLTKKKQSKTKQSTFGWFGIEFKGFLLHQRRYIKKKTNSKCKCFTNRNNYNTHYIAAPTKKVQKFVAWVFRLRWVKNLHKFNVYTW